MQIQCGTNPDGSPQMVPVPDISGSGGGDVDVTKWGAQRINLSIQDIQQTIQEGIASGNIMVINISGSVGGGVRGY